MMRRSVFPILAVAGLVSTSIASPSLAGSPYDDGYDPRLAPLNGGVADVTNPGMVYAQPNGAGQYDCQVGEKRTRLQRRACGPMQNPDAY